MRHVFESSVEKHINAIFTKLAPGFESPQLHPDRMAASHFGGRPASCLMP